MSSRHALAPLALVALLAGCESPPPGDPVDAGADAAVDSGGRRVDAGEAFDAGPPVTGCELLDASHPDGGAPVPLGDGGTIDPAAFPPARGPGGPGTSFTEEQLLESCGYLDFGPTDEKHHNTGFVLDGYLVRPWAHEHGRGGIAVFEFDEPCTPVTVANVLDEQIRETHATGFSPINGRWIVVASLGGVQFWDVSDITAPRMVTDMALPGVTYPDAYKRTVMSAFWQAPYVYVGGSDNGLYVIDATDPTAPELVNTYVPGGSFRLGQVNVVGNVLMVHGSENSRADLLDVSDPANPRAIAGGSYKIHNNVIDRLGRISVRPAYFGHLNGGYAYHALVGLGGGLSIFDVRDPSAPTWVGGIDTPDSAGGYVFVHEGRAFVGLSNYGTIFDVSDPTSPTEVGRVDFPGDLDTMTPFGNVILVSVDDDSVDGHASTIVPWQREPDARGPRVNMIVPRDGATAQALSSRVGLTFDEFVAMESVWRGSIQVRKQGTSEPIDGWLSGQEGIVNFWPARPLEPSTTYEIVVPAGGVTDIGGNATDTEFTASFTTVACD